MAIKYVSSSATGSDDGTSPTHTGGTTGPWTFAQMLSATPAAGDEIRIMADGTYTRSATGTVAFANGTAAAIILITGANSSGTVDGTRPTIQASAGSITLLSITGSHISVRYLIADGNNQSSVTGISLGSTYERAMNCKAVNCTNVGINVSGSNEVFAAFCEASGCSGTAGFSVGGRAFYCEAYGNTTHGFTMGQGSLAVGCISSGNTGGSSDGFNCTSVGYFVFNSVAYGNGRNGFDLTGNAGFGSYLSNCLSVGNTSEGYGTNAVKAGAFLQNCAGYNNTSGNYNATNLPNVSNFQNLSGNPFTNAGSGDFSINNTAGAGAQLRAAGYPGLLPRGTTTGYSDIGAVQHQDAGGGGGLLINSGMTGGMRG